MCTLGDDLLWPSATRTTSCPGHPRKAVLAFRGSFITCEVIEKLRVEPYRDGMMKTNTFTVHTIESAPEKSKPTLQGMKQKFGFLPNIMGTMAENPTLLNGFTGAFGSFHSGSFNEAEKQVLLLTNAVFFKAPWTIAAHSAFALLDGLSESEVKALRDGKLPEDPKYAALSQLSKAVLANRGNVTEADIEVFTSVGYSRAQIFEVVLGVGISTITATITNLAGTPIDDPFKAQTWSRS